MSRSICITAIFGILACGLALHAADGDPVRKKLDDAKAAYDKATMEYKTEAEKWFEKEDDAARKLKSGVTEKVKQVAGEKKDFDEKGVLPKRVPLTLKDKPAKAAELMVKAFKSASDEYSRQKKDEAAVTVEKELEAFKTSNLLQDSRKRWVHDKGEFRVVEMGIWEEKWSNGKTFRYKEVSRTKDYVEIDALNGELSIRVRLYDARCDYGNKPKLNYTTFFMGKWVKD